MFRYVETCAVRHLCDAVVLQVDDSGHGHLHAAEHRHHLQLLIVKRRSAEVLNKADESKQETVTFIFLFRFHIYSLDFSYFTVLP